MNGAITKKNKQAFKCASMYDKIPPFKSIKAFVFDVDGVLTDGMVHVTDHGEQLRYMSVKDGYAIKKALQMGYHLAVISGGSSIGAQQRLTQLGISDVFISVKNKLPVFEQWIKNRNLNPKEVLYMGDDIPDIPVLNACGLPSCPSDAVDEVKHYCQYISPLAGGQNCVRDVIEKVLKLNQQWFNICDRKI